MPTPRNVYMTAIAATLVIIALPHAADARGGGHGGIRGGMSGSMAGRMGMATSHAALAPRSPAPLATAPGGKTGPQPPSQITAADEAAASAVQSTSIATTALPPSAIAAPAPQEPAIAPLSPGPAQIIDSSGGGVTSTSTSSSSTATTSAASGPSPSESAPSAPGGGGDTLQACMGFWDSGTHMTKVEWRAACTRTLNRLDLRTPVP